MHDRTLGPKLSHCAQPLCWRTALCLAPRFRIATRAAPQCLKLAPPAPFGTRGSAAPLLHSPAPLYA